LLGGVVPIGRQPSLGDEVAEIVNRGQVMPRRELNDLAVMRVRDMTAFALAGTLASWRRMRVGKATS